MLSSPDQYMHTRLHWYSAGLNYHLNDRWTISTTYSFSNSARDRNESTLSLQNAAGDYTDKRFISKQNQLTQASDVVQKSWFASDTIALTQHWSMLGGMRYTHYEQRSYPGGRAAVPSLTGGCSA